MCIRDRYVLGEQPDLDQLEQGQKAGFAGKHILLVEDNALNREVATELLEDMGAKIDIACDGEQGVEAFRRSEEGFFCMIQMCIRDRYYTAYGLLLRDLYDIPGYGKFRRQHI